MSNVVPFGPKPADIVTPSLVGADGQEVKTTRSVQNDIIQRRNFILIDCVTGETIVANGNAVQAYLAVQGTLPQLLLNTIQQVSGQVAVNVFKQIAAADLKESAEPVTENSPE